MIRKAVGALAGDARRVLGAVRPAPIPRSRRGKRRSARPTRPSCACRTAVRARATLQRARADPRGRHRRQADAEARLDHRDDARRLRRGYPYYHGAVLKEGVQGDRVERAGSRDDNYDEFVFVGLHGQHAVGRHALHFPTIQECEQGQQAWAEIPAAGQDRRTTAISSPALRLVRQAAGARRMRRTGGCQDLQGRLARHRGAMVARDAGRRARRRRLPEDHQHRHGGRPADRRHAATPRRRSRSTR